MNTQSPCGCLRCRIREVAFGSVDLKDCSEERFAEGYANLCAVVGEMVRIGGPTFLADGVQLIVDVASVSPIEETVGHA